MEAAILRMPDERQDQILDRLRRGGRVLASELAIQFGISEDTARRDLRALAAAGLCRRVYGGALPLSPAGGPIAQREGEQIARKAALGRAAAALVADVMPADGLLFLDAGSTNLAVASALPQTLAITVATNAPQVAVALAANRAIDVIMIGGSVNRRCGAALGTRALRDLAGMRIDLALLGACAADAGAGIAAFDPDAADFQRAMARAASMVATVALTDKLGTAAPFRVIDAARLGHLVVEADAPDALVAPFRACGVATHRADAP
jgi:DeoR/GlpR family transcriptional regulator of sugar metabolism